MLRIVFLLFSLVSLNNLSAQINSDFKLNQPKDNRISEAYGYLLGQESTLKRIEIEIPQLALQVIVARTSFNQTFGNAKKGLENYLKKSMGNENYIKYNNELQTIIDSLSYQQELIEENAMLFIDEVKNRANGKIENSTILKTLLGFQYASRPHDEYLNGFTQTFSTKNHPKGRNSDCSIRLPISWRAAEGNRPHIVQKFINDYGDGLQFIMLWINDIPLEANQTVTEDDLNEVFSDSGIVSLIPEDATLISFAKIKLDGQIGGMIEFEQVANSLDVTSKIRMIQFSTIYDNICYSIQGSIYSPNPEADLSNEMKKYLPLFKLVANSLVLNNKYK